MAILATRVNARPLLVTAAILAAIIPLLLAAVFLVQSVANQALATQKTVRSARLSRDSAVTLQLNEETGIRGYVATRDQRFLAPYTLGAGQLPAILSQLHSALVALNVREAIAATDSARDINAQWLKSFAAPILKDPNRGQIAMQLRGKDLVDRYRAQMRAISVTLETVQEQADARTVAAVNRIFVVGVGAALAIIAVAVVYGMRQAALMQRLEESERRAVETRRIREFQTLGQAMEQMLWTARPDGTVDYYSDRWAEYAGIPTSALAAQGWMSLVHPDDAGGLEDWNAAVREVTAFTIENRVRRSDGTYRWHVHRVLPIRDARNDLTAWFATSTDIDEQKHEVASLRAAYDSEKRIADTLQEALLQQALPTVAGLGFSATYVPASDESKVGGDWYDALKLPDGRIFFSMGDVAGHGLDAAIVMSRARQAIISAALHEIDPAIVLTRANTTLLVQNTRMVTAVCGYIDPSTFALAYAGAGHPPPVLVELGRPARLLQTGGLPLAVMNSVTYYSHRLNVAPGSLLVLYTDGAVEHSRDPLEGEAILLEAAAHAMDVPAAVRAETIHDRIFTTRTVGDDVAIMTVAFGNEMVLPENLVHEIARLRELARIARA